MAAPNLSRPTSLRERVWLLMALFLFLAALMWAVPRLSGPDRSQTSTYETGAIATLRNLISAQGMARSSRKIDVDGDGRGEFGTFGEMTAVAGIRTSADGSSRGQRMEPSILSPSLAPRADRPSVTKAGYCFRIFLPAGPSTATTEGDPGKALSPPVATDLAEERWCAYAWPLDIEKDGQRAFYVDEGGDIWWCFNDVRKYSGPGNVPDWDAALPAGSPREWRTRRLAVGTGNDGERWEKTR